MFQNPFGLRLKKPRVETYSRVEGKAKPEKGRKDEADREALRIVNKYVVVCDERLEKAIARALRKFEDRGARNPYA